MKKTIKVYITIYVCKEDVKSYPKTKIFRATDAKLRNFVGPKNGKITTCTTFHRMSGMHNYFHTYYMASVARMKLNQLAMPIHLMAEY